MCGGKRIENGKKGAIQSTKLIEMSLPVAFRTTHSLIIAKPFTMGTYFE
jgi:hypothetical protein